MGPNYLGTTRITWDSANTLQIPTLEDVTLRISSSPNPLSALPLKWSQLTRLRLECHSVWREDGDAEGGLDVGAAFDVLRRCPNLVYCEIRVTRASEKPFTLDTSSIILPHLCTLVLSGFHFEFQSWISQLVLPNLRSLRLGDVALEEIASSATRDGSMCADIDTNRFTSSSLHELLESFPTISQLRLSSIHFQELLPDDALWCSYTICAQC
ncbi:hypothetical protein B0H14DRAFT_821625 [Mycena olivaceomarginata]|nr:hypothetical protein B0H14DRAFT_821625 [Mycena olivaceomarginata]